MFIYLFQLTYAIGSVNWVTQLRTDGVHCRESAGTGPVVLKVVPVTDAATLKVTMDQLMCGSIFPRPRSRTYTKTACYSIYIPFNGIWLLTYQVNDL